MGNVFGANAPIWNSQPATSRSGRSARSRAGARPGRARRCGRARPARGVGHVRLEPAASRARNAAPSAPPSGTAHTCTGRSVQSASAWTHPSTASRRRSRRCAAAGTGARVDHAARDEGRRPRTRRAGSRRGPWVRSRSTSCAAARRVLERHPLAARVRDPDGTRRRQARVVGVAGAEQRDAQSRNRPPALLGPPTRNFARRGVRDRVVVRIVDELGHHRPHDQRRAEDHEHVAVVVGAGDELLGERVDRAALEDAAADPGTSAERLSRDAEPGNCSTRAPARGDEVFVPAASSRTAGTRSPRRSSRSPAVARERVVRDGLGRPVAARVGQFARPATAGTA